MRTFVDRNQNRALEAIASRVLPGSGRATVERTASGVSTPVFRIRRGGTTLYLRLAESPEAFLAPEVLAHALLRERGVRVPEVVHFEPFNDVLGRSLMVTAEIPGAPIGSSSQSADVDVVLAAAGRDLAIMHGIAVDGFGWIRRADPAASRLEAPLPSLRAFALDDLEAHLAELTGLLTVDEIEAVGRAAEGGIYRLTTNQATLAHGDFDTTHIFHHRGRYSGIIDLGEIRGADAFYDLGHFALHDGEKLPRKGLPALLAGYSQVTPLSEDAQARIRLWSLLIGVRALARAAGRPQGAYGAHLVRAMRATLAALEA